MAVSRFVFLYQAQSRGIQAVRIVDERLMSYNVEMTEVTGGTFWKAYTPGQIAGTEPLPPLVNLADMVKLQEWYAPIDTKNERLINLARAFGPVWVRVSGTWANRPTIILMVSTSLVWFPRASRMCCRRISG